MKKIILLLALVFSFNQAQAQISNDLVGLGMKPELADYISGIIPGGAVLSNNVTLKGRNQAGSADISLIKVDATDDTTIVSDSGDLIKLLLQGDANRLLTFSGSSDTNLILQWGDGSTASQLFTIQSSDADASDDGALILVGGGNEDKTRGAYIQLNGNEFTGAGDVMIATGSAAGSSFLVDLNATAGTLIIRDSAAASILTVTESTKAAVFSGAVTSNATGALGWSYVTGANTACTTTCTFAAVFGVDLAAGASAPVIVDASSATADACVCAGAN